MFTTKQSVGFWIVCILFWTLLPPNPGMAQDSPIVILGSESYTPFYFRDAQGNAAGIFVDHWKLWGLKTGQKIKFQTQSFSDVLKTAKANPNAIVSGFFHSPKREQHFDFSTPFYEIPTHIFFHKQIYGFKDLTDLSGFTIGTVKDDYSEEYILKTLPSAQLSSHASFENLILAAVEGRIKVFVCDSPVARFLLSKHAHGDRFKQAAQPLYVSKVFAGVQKGNTALLEKINSGLKKITADEMADIDRRWNVVPKEKGKILPIIAATGGGVALLVAMLFLWNFQLRRRVRFATGELKDKQSQLKISEKALQTANQELEERVQRRTWELSASNEKLRIKIDDHSRTATQLAKVNAYLTALQDTMMGLIRRLDVEELLEAIIHHATDATNAKHGYVYLRTAGSDELVLHVGRGLFASAIGYRIVAGDGLAGKVLVSGQLLSVDNYYKWDGRYEDSHWDTLGAIVGIPMKSGSEVVGVIGLGHTKDMGQFGNDEILFLKGFSELASIALDNAHLYSNLQKELKQRKQNELERLQLEEKFRQAQKMEAIGTLAGGIAHDFNNILSAILGYTELAITKIDAHGTLHQYLSNVYQSALRAKDLVQQILTFSRKSTQENSPLYLAPIVKEGIKLIRASIPSSIEIRQNLNCDDMVVNANPVQIHQILMNLSVNASHVMEEHGGTLTINLDKATLDHHFDAGHPEFRPGDYACLKIQDTGNGMPPEILERIFEPYFTTKEMERGTGLGLSVVHGIVKNHGGLIKVQSTIGVGTTFEIYFPVCQKPEVQSDQRLDEQPVSGGPEHILLVDDEPVLASVNQQLLEQLGYRVTACTDSQIALETFARDPDAYDLVLTDMTMPKVTGDKLAQSLLDIDPKLPIIVYTGYSHRISPERAKKIGIRALLMKPLVKSEMARAIRKALEAN